MIGTRAWRAAFRAMSRSATWLITWGTAFEKGVFLRLSKAAAVPAQSWVSKASLRASKGAELRESA